MAENAENNVDWVGVFGEVLKYGIDRKIDAERQEEVYIREPTEQNEINQSGKSQRMGTTSGSAFDAVPEWVKYAGGGLLVVASLAVVVAAVK